MLDKEEQESEVIKDSPDSPEPLNKKPRLCTEEVQPPERAKGTDRHHTVSSASAPRKWSKSSDDITTGSVCSDMWLSLAVGSGPVSLLTMWSNRITVANSRKHQEFVGRVSSVNNKFELYQQLKDENGCVRKIYCLSLYGCNIPLALNVSKLPAVY